MSSLVKKDYKFSALYVFIAIALSVFFPVLFFFIPAGDFSIMIYILGPFLSSVLFVNKACYLDDEEMTRMFLKSLPVKKSDQVTSKYITAISMVAISIGIITLTASLLGLPVAIESILLSFAVMLLYYSIYFILFFKYNYNVAQKTSVIVMLLVIVVAAALSQSGQQLMLTTLNFSIFLAIFLITIVLYLISIRVTIKLAR